MSNAEQNKDDEEKGWLASAAKTLGVLVGVVSLLAAAASLYDWATSRKVAINTEGDYVIFEAANDFPVLTPQGNSPVSADELEQFIPPGVAKRDWIAADLKRYLDKVEPTVPVEKIKSLSSFWKFTIRNEGNKEAQNVELHVPCTGWYKLMQGGEKHIFERFDRVATIKRLRPTETVLVAVWGDNPADIEGKRLPYDSYNAEMVKVIHGDDAFSVNYPYRLTGGARWVANNPGWLLAGVFILLAAYIVADSLLARRSRRKKGSGQSRRLPPSLQAARE